MDYFFGYDKPVIGIVFPRAAPKYQQESTRVLANPLYLLLLQAVFVFSWSSGFISERLGAQNAGAINLRFWRFLLVMPQYCQRYPRLIPHDC
ncbi:hypothetical protein [Pseudomonas sp. L1(2025)]|uniref:hypothetical protein n=1 Tax=Pseudomonas sp. L1(2025) TaxID=3449429 RepID=UPI003F68FE26